MEQPETMLQKPKKLKCKHNIHAVCKCELLRMMASRMSTTNSISTLQSGTGSPSKQQLEYLIDVYMHGKGGSKEGSARTDRHNTNSSNRHDSNSPRLHQKRKSKAKVKAPMIDHMHLIENKSTEQLRSMD